MAEPNVNIGALTELAGPLTSMIPGLNMLGPMMSLFGGAADQAATAALFEAANAQNTELSDRNALGGQGSMLGFSQQGDNLVGGLNPAMQALMMQSGGMASNLWGSGTREYQQMGAVAPGMVDQQNQLLQMQAPGANLQNLFGQSQGAYGNMLGRTAGGPQDMFGGLGMQNLQAGSQGLQQNNYQDVYDSVYGNLAAGQEQFQNQQFNKLEARQQARGRMGSSGGAGQMAALMGEQAAQNRTLQGQAHGMALQAQQQQGQRAMQQMQAGQGMYGQNLNLYGQDLQAAQGFGGMAGQQGMNLFQQMMNSQNANVSRGQQRVGNMYDMFTNLGQQQQQGFTQGQGFLQNMLGGGQLEAGLMGSLAGGYGSQLGAYADFGANAANIAQAQAASGASGGPLGMIGGLFG